MCSLILEVSLVVVDIGVSRVLLTILEVRGCCVFILDLRVVCCC